MSIHSVVHIAVAPHLAPKAEDSAEIHKIINSFVEGSTTDSIHSTAFVRVLGTDSEVSWNASSREGGPVF